MTCHNRTVSPEGAAARARSLGVVVFSGGRGSGALVRQLVARAGVSLTLAINGYDDGASTGAVRRFLADSLGPSDFRKNVSRLARSLQTCDPALIDALDTRLPSPVTDACAVYRLNELRRFGPSIAVYLDAFLAEHARARPVSYTHLTLPTNREV